MEITPYLVRNSIISSTSTILSLSSLIGVIAGIVVITNVNVIGGSILTAGSGVLLIGVILTSILLLRFIRQQHLANKKRKLLRDMRSNLAECQNLFEGIRDNNQKMIELTESSIAQGEQILNMLESGRKNEVYD